jgi:hypothetical protein
LPVPTLQDEKGAGATAPSRGRGIFQQKNTRDRVLYDNKK